MGRQIRAVLVGGAPAATVLLVGTGRQARGAIRLGRAIRPFLWHRAWILRALRVPVAVDRLRLASAPVAKVTRRALRLAKGLGGARFLAGLCCLAHRRLRVTLVQRLRGAVRPAVVDAVREVMIRRRDERRHRNASMGTTWAAIVAATWHRWIMLLNASRPGRSVEDHAASEIPIAITETASRVRRKTTPAATDVHAIFTIVVHRASR